MEGGLVMPRQFSRIHIRELGLAISTISVGKIWE